MLDANPFGSFHHEALLYSGDDEFASRAGAFLARAAAAAEPAFAIVDAHKIEQLRAALGPHAARVHLVDSRQLGRNPSRVLDAWRAFVAEHTGPGPICGVGEPLGTRDTDVEREECSVYEALMNLALSDARLRLLCAYDTSRLGATDVQRARLTHPYVQRDGDTTRSGGIAAVEDVIGTALAEPDDVDIDIGFDLSMLREVRAVVGRRASAFGMAAERTFGLELAATEVATNSVLYGGGRGRLRTWTDEAGLVCELSDAGRIAEPLAGRLRPERGQAGGYGLWVAQQLCDLVQIRTGASGTVVRLRMLR